MKEKLQELFKPDKLMALTKKEVLELIRNKYLVFLILIPPVVQLLILCAALDPRVNDLNLSVVDNSSTALSRSLITKLIDTTVFTEPKLSGDERGSSAVYERGELQHRRGYSYKP